MIRFLAAFSVCLMICQRGTAAEKPALEGWKHSALVAILTTAEGAALPAGVVEEDFPILVTLQRDHFDFQQAHPTGRDLRVTSLAGDPLAFQVNHWDAAAGQASVWVRIPRIEGNAKQSIRLHWGNPDAEPIADAAPVFSESNGFLSVLHLDEGESLRDATGRLSLRDTGTTSVAGVIGQGRHFAENRGIFGGEKIEGFPTGSSSHSTSAWFRAARPNGTLLGWGNEQAQGKVVMQFRSPPHVGMDCYFSDGNVSSAQDLSLGEWIHVIHTYDRGTARLYINGTLSGMTTRAGGPLNVRTPARFWLGGWYHNYSYAGDLDEVRVAGRARSDHWIRLEFENQKPQQTLVGPPQRPGMAFSVEPREVRVREGQVAMVTAEIAGAQKIFWSLKRDGRDEVIAVDRLRVEIPAGRVTGPESATLTVKAVFPDQVRSLEIPMTIAEDVPDPEFTLDAPATWDGRRRMELAPQIVNLPALQVANAQDLRFRWSIEGLATTHVSDAGRLILTRAHKSGPMTVVLTGDNGGTPVTRKVVCQVTEPAAGSEPWVPRPLFESEQPEDDQFIPRDGTKGKRTGTLVYKGTLASAADSVFLRVYANETLKATETGKVRADRTYSLSVPIAAGLIRYRTEFGTRTGDREEILHSAKNIVCGDVYVIQGQSNAVATDFGKGDPPEASDWVRTFGATDGSPQGSRLKLWGNAQARGPGGKSEVGYWGLELGRRLVDQEQLPVCLLNGAVGGTRIDQHLPDTEDRTDVRTIYGRLLWRAREARLTHGVRAILWHQGENDQGADGPSGGYGWETYRENFITLAGAWKDDFPNVQNYYVFQIWPKACAMGIRGSDNRLRDVQRRLPDDFSNVSVMSTLGIKPPGGCHYPAAGYAEFARLIQPVLARDLYERNPPGPVTPPNLRRAWFGTAEKTKVVLEFDSPVTWSAPLARHFFLEDRAGQVVEGSVDGTRLTLSLKEPSSASRISYLDSASWNPDQLLMGANGLAALTFFEVPIVEPE